MNNKVAVYSCDGLYKGDCVNYKVLAVSRDDAFNFFKNKFRSSGNVGVIFDIVLVRTGETNQITQSAYHAVSTNGYIEYEEETGVST